MNEVIVITGGSSGIGLATAAALRKRNCRVYELSRRNVEHENGVLHLSADVTDEAADSQRGQGGRAYLQCRLRNLRGGGVHGK